MSKVRLFLPDGTEIDDEEYFANLDNQAVIFASKFDSLNSQNDKLRMEQRKTIKYSVKWLHSLK